VLPQSPSIRIGVVAGEVSGDLLGAGLIRALKERYPITRFEGIGGSRMKTEGCISLFPMERLSVIGFEGIRSYPSILQIRRRLVAYFQANPPDLFIGIDVPDFNLGLERKLKSVGITTVHYVSPTVWAWRSYRIRRIRKSVDHLLALFPFEEKYYQEHHIPVTFVGHPMADEIDDEYDRNAIRKGLNLSPDHTIVALLPGSRMNELVRHADLFVRTAKWLHHRNTGMHFIAPFVNIETKTVFEKALKKHGAESLNITLLLDHSRDVLAASDIALLASGTAALEAALLQKLMVVTYKISFISYIFIRLLSHIDLYSLPNNLAGYELVPEFMQFDARPEKLGNAIEYYLTHPKQAEIVKDALAKIHNSLRTKANVRAAEAVAKLIAAKLGRGDTPYFVAQD